MRMSLKKFDKETQRVATSLQGAIGGSRIRRTIEKIPQC